MKRLSTASPSPHRCVDEMHATEIRRVNEIRTTFKNNIDRLQADYKEKLDQKMAEMTEKLRSAKAKKWCPVCQKEVTIDAGFDPSACSIPCWKVLL